MPAYKTIVLELLQGQPELYEQLRSRKRLLPTLEDYAIELKAHHERWTQKLRVGMEEFRPADWDWDSEATQVASLAMELAVDELIREHLPSASPKDEAEPLSLDAAMAYIRRHTPPA